MKSNKTILIAIALGILAVVLVNAHISRLKAKAEEPKVTFYRATVDILPGQTVNDAVAQKYLVAFREIPLSFARAYPKAVDGREYDLWANHRIERAIPAGEFLQTHHLKVSSSNELARMIPTGHSLIAIPANQDTAVGFLIAPGDVVDVYATQKHRDATKPGGMEVVVLPVARGLTVFAVGDYYGPEGDTVRPRGRGYDSITLSGATADIEQILAARQRGTLTLTLPSPRSE